MIICSRCGDIMNPVDKASYARYMGEYALQQVSPPSISTGVRHNIFEFTCPLGHSVMVFLKEMIYV